MIAFLAAAIGGLMLMMGSAFLYYRLEWKAVAICAALPAVTVALTGQAYGVPPLVAPLLVGCLGGYTFKRGKSLGFFLVTASVALALVFGAVFYYMMHYGKIDYFGMMRTEMANIMAATGAPDDVRTEMLREFEGSRDEMIALIPFSLFAYSLVMAGIGYAIMKRFFVRVVGVAPGDGLELFRLHDYYVFVLIAGLALRLLIDKSDYPVLHSAGQNIALSMALLYFVQALGVIRFLLMRRGVPGYVLPLVLAGVLLTGMVAAGMFLLILLAGVGALDVWADFRKLSGRGEPEQ